MLAIESVQCAWQIYLYKNCIKDTLCLRVCTNLSAVGLPAVRANHLFDVVLQIDSDLVLLPPFFSFILTKLSAAAQHNSSQMRKVGKFRPQGEQKP